ncbi:hypothetical protein [Acidithiobacillus sulfurivorans]|uniref:Uncharacterized protein n=1 Tax=Acidithiobacillus sulfurivorans TaxID=1958756 RepID=A0ABS5ZZJ4_9PROT|nr:hypothetical protein [Acidithiobacillus sulfurivorans]MBU2760336.1 hypothetical protein [Acidithiobacillus sulfurivorans]
MIIQPKHISPGWAKRWTLQSVDLFRRAPGLAVGIMALFALVNAFVPQPLALDVPITVFLMGLLFSSLRAADHDSGRSWSAAWAFFRQTSRDLAHMARDLFLVMLAVSVMMGLFFAFYSAATHGANVVKPNPAFFQLPGWMRSGTARSGSMLILGVFMPGFIPLIFLTMSVGNQPLMHYVSGFHAAILNMKMTYAVSITGMTSCIFLLPVLRQMPSPTLGIALMVCFAMAFWWFGTWGYLWCREMFDGTEENAKETAKQHVHIMAQEENHA